MNAAKQTTDAVNQTGEGVRPGAFNPPGLNPPTISIGERQAQANEAEKPLDDGTK